MFRNLTRERYLPSPYSGIVKDPSAQFDYFKPGADGRDRYGNAFFPAIGHLAYFDREKKPVKPGLLVSPEGRQFMLQHRGVVKALDEVLESFRPASPKMIIAGGITLEPLSIGSQSCVYFLETREPAGRYVVKVPNTDSSENVDQPYVYEMLQTQQISRDLGRMMWVRGLSLNRFLLASGQVAIIRYEEGVQPDRGAIEERARPLKEAIDSYISFQQTMGNSLWKNIKTDFEDRGVLRLDNFKAKPDGEIVWVDPFYYHAA